MVQASGLKVWSDLRPALIGAVLVLVLFDNAKWLYYDGKPSWGLDFMVFWQAGRRAVEDAYLPSFFPFVYPPTALFLFKPLGLLPISSAYPLWTLASILLFGAMAWRYCGPAVAALSLLAPPAVRGIVLGQSSMLLAGLALLAFALPPFWGGVLLGLIMAVKPQMLLFAPVALLVRRDWAILRGMAVGAGGLLLASLLAFPSLWPEWFKGLPLLEDGIRASNSTHALITPAGRADHLGLPSLPFMLLGAGIGLAAIAAVARKVEGAALLALIVASSLAIAPYGLIHDLVAIAPFAAAMLLRGPLLLTLAGAALLVGNMVFAPFLILLMLLLLVYHRKRAVIVSRVAGWRPKQMKVPVNETFPA